MVGVPERSIGESLSKGMACRPRTYLRKALFDCPIDACLLLSLGLVPTLYNIHVCLDYLVQDVGVLEFLLQELGAN